MITSFQGKPLVQRQDSYHGLSFVYFQSILGPLYAVVIKHAFRFFGDSRRLSQKLNRFSRISIISRCQTRNHTHSTFIHQAGVKGLFYPDFEDLQ